MRKLLYSFCGFIALLPAIGMADVSDKLGGHLQGKVDGQTVTTQSLDAYGRQNVQLNVGGIPAGFYFLQVITEDGKAVQKIVIE